ncbi:single-stranded DNA-binding protein [Candidatus Saccharibacteria bacterium]|nr:MAG: single-stranded DNA-binding protein [Candidatus Saccharibacteria bacterium]
MDQQQSIEFAAEYLEDLLSFFGINIMVDKALSDDVIELDIPNIEESSILIGRNAETLRAFQYMISTVLRNKNASLVRVNVDIAGYKKQRAEKLAEKARGWIDEIRRTGEPHTAHINAADRRVVHRLAQEYDDIQTHSEGEGKNRSITIELKSA